MGLVSKRLNELVSSEVNANGNISDNQIECAKKVLYAFDSDYPKSNYVVIKGQTQAGKTGVLYGIANIINRHELKETLGLKRIMYITGDNSKDLVKQQEGRSEREIMNYRDEDVKVMFMKRSDFKKYITKEKSIDGTIIFIDESHFGTNSKVNQLPKFLKHYGIDYLKNTNLEEHNIRIISNTATPYCELASDKVQNKLTVLLEPSEGYVGILDFANNVIPLSKNVFERGYVDKALPSLLDKTYEHLKEIEETKGKVKCAIFRACGKNDIANIEKYASDKFDIYQFDTSKCSALNYNNLWNQIDMYCGMAKGRTPNKYLLVVVKDALRMGISVRDRNDHNDTKNRIGTLYDYPSDKDKPEVTEQGLLGRMCGYREEGDTEWTDIRFYLNETHWNTLKSAYEKGLLDDNGRLRTLSLAKKHTDKSEITSVDGLEIGKDYKLAIKNEGIYYTYDITDFVKQKGYTLNELKDNNGKGHFQYVDKILYPFTNEVLKDSRYKDGTYLLAQSLKTYKGMITTYQGYDKYVANMQNENAPIDMTGSKAYTWVNEPQSIGKLAYEWLLDMTDAENPFDSRIYIKIKMGTVYPYKEVTSFVDGGGVDTAPTMITG